MPESTPHAPNAENAPPSAGAHAPAPDDSAPLRGRSPARRGFGAMSPEKQREIASMGGKAAQAKGTCHRFTSETGKAAGKLGGIIAGAKGRAEARCSRCGSTGHTRRRCIKPEPAIS